MYVRCMYVQCMYGLVIGALDEKMGCTFTVIVSFGWAS